MCLGAAARHGASHQAALTAAATPAPPAPQVITIICNLVMLLYFGGEIQEMRSVHGGGFGSDKGGEASPISADMQTVQLGSVSSGPTFRVGDSLAAPGANPFAQPV